MSQTPKNDSFAKIRAIELALIDDVMQTPIDELEREFVHDGLDINEIAAAMRNSAMELIMLERRKLLAKARTGLVVHGMIKSQTQQRPTIETIKRRLAQLFIEKPSLAIAFRQGKSQSESDWYSLWDDLIELGEISRIDDES